MSKLLLSCLMLAALPASGDERQEIMPAILYTTFKQPAPPAVTDALEDEVETIMGPLGRHFAWRSIASSRGNEISTELAVLTFVGHCDISGIRPRATNPGALGWTHVSDGAILPFSDIDCDRVRVFLQKDLLYIPTAERETAFGRALGRVVAHELYHIFANTSHHGSDGVAKAAYTSQDLLSDEFQFEDREGHALRTTAPGMQSLAPSSAAKSVGHGF